MAGIRTSLKTRVCEIGLPVFREWGAPRTRIVRQD